MNDRRQTGTETGAPVTPNYIQGEEMKLEKMAMADAKRYAVAEMFFGEGAGTARKLLNAELIHKEDTIPGYIEAFDTALQKVDLADAAILAAEKRKKIDRGQAFKRNIRGIATGNRRSMTTWVVTGFVVYGFMVRTGLDEPAKIMVKNGYNKVKTEYTVWNARRRLQKKH